MFEIAVYDTKPGAEPIVWRFHEFRLSVETAPAAKGAQAVCVFVNDQADRDRSTGARAALPRDDAARPPSHSLT